MPFPLTEHNALLALKGIAPVVIARLEQMGIDLQSSTPGA